MNAPRNERRNSQVADLKLISLTLLDFLGSTESGLSAEATASFKEAVASAAAKGHVTALRMAQNDLIAMLQLIPGRERRGLDAMLKERANLSVDVLLAKQLARVRAIAQRGKIKNDTEYYLIREHVEMIWDNPDASDESKRLVELLNRYEETAARRGGSRQGDSSAV